MSHPNAELRLLEVFYHKIYKVMFSAVWLSLVDVVLCFIFVCDLYVFLFLFQKKMSIVNLFSGMILAWLLQILPGILDQKFKVNCEL